MRINWINNHYITILTYAFFSCYLSIAYALDPSDATMDVIQRLQAQQPPPQLLNADLCTSIMNGDDKVICRVHGDGNQGIALCRYNQYADPDGTDIHVNCHQFLTSQIQTLTTMRNNNLPTIAFYDQVVNNVACYRVNGAVKYQAQRLCALIVIQFLPSNYHFHFGLIIRTINDLHFNPPRVHGRTLPPLDCNNQVAIEKVIRDHDQWKRFSQFLTPQSNIKKHKIKHNVTKALIAIQGYMSSQPNRTRLIMDPQGLVDKSRANRPFYLMDPDGTTFIPHNQPSIQYQRRWQSKVCWQSFFPNLILMIDNIN